MDSVLSCKQNLHMKRKKLIKILGAVVSTESCKYRQLDGIWENVWSFYHGTTALQHLIDPRQMASLREPSKVVVSFYGMLLLSARCPRPPGRWETAIRKTIWRTIARGNKTFWSNGWKSSVFTERSGENSSIWQESITKNLSGLWAERAESLERRILIADLDQKLRKFSSKNQRKGSIDQTKRWWIHIPSSSRRCSKIVRERLRIPSTHTKARTTCKEWKSQWVKFKANREGLNRQEQQMTLEPVPILGRHKVTSSIVITMNLEFNSTCRRKKHSPIPQKFIDVPRSTHTDLDVVQNKKINDYWNVDSSKHLSDSRRGFRKFTLLKEKAPKRIFVVPGETDEDSNDYQTRLCMARRVDENW